MHVETAPANLHIDNNKCNISEFRTWFVAAVRNSELTLLCVNYLMKKINPLAGLASWNGLCN